MSFLLFLDKKRSYSQFYKREKGDNFMEQRDFESELKEYKRKKIAKNVSEETLSEDEHRLLVEESEDEELLGIYDDLKDLELIDLQDYFVLERSDGGI